jgi:hypothetical protein
MWNGKDDVFEAYAALRISGPGLSPAEISERLTLQASHTCIHNGKGMWVYSTKESLDCLLRLEEHILRIIEVVQPRAQALSEIQQRYKTDVLCHFASESDFGGYKLSSKTLLALGQFGLGINTDEYFCGRGIV